MKDYVYGLSKSRLSVIKLLKIQNNNFDCWDDSKKTRYLLKKKFRNLSLIPINKTNLKNYNNKSHNIIFVDPPFASNYLLKTLKLLSENDFFEDNQYIYIERDKKDNSSELVSFLSKTHNILKDLSMGDVSYTIAKKRDK